MCCIGKYKCKVLCETYGSDDDKRTIPLTGFFNVRIENTGTDNAWIFDKSLLLQPGIPVCVGIQHIPMADDTVLEFENAPNTIQEVKIIKYDVIECQSNI